jgi:hypothetical protein
MTPKGENHIDEAARPVVWHVFDVGKDNLDVLVACGSCNGDSLWKMLTWRWMSAGRASVSLTDGEGVSE